MENKTHYRKVFKSDHLGVADLEEFLEEGKDLIFTIKEVKQEFQVLVAGRIGNFNIAYFIQSIKPLVLNAINSKTVRMFADGSPFVEDWKMLTVELFIDKTVRMKGEVVGGIRIKSTQPKLEASPLYEEFKKLFQEKADKIPAANFPRVEKYFNNKTESQYQKTIDYLKTL